MNLSLSAGVSPLASPDPAGAKPGLNNDPAKNAKAARDFEALLLTPVLDALQKTFSGDAEDAKTPGASDYRHMATQALAQSIAGSGGIGIAQLILRHLEPPKVPGTG
jgi:Rod binding domain-containing protein